MLDKFSPPQARLTIPLEITINLGSPGQLSAFSLAPSGLATQALQLRLTRAAEAVRLDTDYGNRTGYASNFLPGVQVLMSGLSPALSKQSAPLRTGEINAQTGLLHYQNFSLVKHKTWRVAIFTGTNIDGDTYNSVNRKTGQVSANIMEGDTRLNTPASGKAFTWAKASRPPAQTTLIEAI